MRLSVAWLQILTFVWAHLCDIMEQASGDPQFGDEDLRLLAVRQFAKLVYVAACSWLAAFGWGFDTFVLRQVRAPVSKRCRPSVCGAARGQYCHGRPRVLIDGKRHG